MIIQFNFSNFLPLLFLLQSLRCLSSFVSLRGNCIDNIIVVFPLGSFNECSFPISYIVLPRPVDIVLSVIQELDPVSNPSGHSWDSEQDRVHVCGETHGSVDQAGVEIHIWIELSGNTKARALFTSIRLQERFFLIPRQSRSKAISRKLRTLRRQPVLKLIDTFLTILALGS